MRVRFATRRFEINCLFSWVQGEVGSVPDDHMISRAHAIFLAGEPYVCISELTLQSGPIMRDRVAKALNAFRHAWEAF